MIEGIARCEQTCYRCHGEGKRKHFADRDPIEGYKLVDKRSCEDCNGTGKVVELKADGKILKNKDYPAVDFGGLV